MRRRLIAAARKVQPGKPILGEQAQRIHAFRRKIDTAIACRCRDEKQALRLNEIDIALGEFAGRFAHL